MILLQMYYYIYLAILFMNFAFILINRKIAIFQSFIELTHKSFSGCSLLREENPNDHFRFFIAY